MFVTRSLLNLATENTRTAMRLADDWKAMHHEAMTWNRALVQQIVDLKRDGHSAPAVGLAAREPDPVSDAINVIAGNNIRERTRLGRVVSLWRAKGRDTDEIVHELLNPAPDEDGVSA